MHESDYSERSFPDVRQPSEVTLDAKDVVKLSTLMRELRDTTLSRASFRAASDFLKLLGADGDSPHLVPADALDR